MNEGGLPTSGWGQVEGLLADLSYSPSPLPAVVHVILESARHIFGFNAGVIYLPDHASKELVYLNHSGFELQTRLEEAPRYGFDGTSLAAKVFRERRGRCSPEPRKDPDVDQRGVEFFGIHSAIVAVPLTHDNQVLGVLVAWNQGGENQACVAIEDLAPFAAFAASHLAAAVVLNKRTKALKEIPKVFTSTLSENSHTGIRKSIMDALSRFPFDRVRLFVYRPEDRAFFPVSCMGMTNEARFLNCQISIDRNPYANDTVTRFSSDSSARIYRGELGPDPDAEVLEKGPVSQWAVAPLGLNGALIGQIVVDNAPTQRPLTFDGLDFLNAMSALTAGALGSSGDIQFLSLKSLPMLYRSLARDDHRSDVIKKLLVYLTCGEALGFSRAIYLDRRDNPPRLVYRSSIGSITEASFHRIGEAAAQLHLSEILRKAPTLYDYELDQRLAGFTVDLSRDGAAALLNEVEEVELRVFGGQEPAPSWSIDLADRLGEGTVMTAPLRVGANATGLFIVDRRWQQPIHHVHTIALKTFAELAGQIVEQNDLQQRSLRKRSDMEWEGMAHYAAHACRDPLTQMDHRLYLMERALARRDESGVTDNLRLAKAAADHMRTFIEDFLMLARPSSFRRVPLQLQSLLEQACDDMKLAERGVRYKVSCTPEVTIVGDQARLMACVREILTNALHWMDKDENLIRIEVNTPASAMTPLSLDSSIRYAVVHIEDNGAGIAYEDQDRVYEAKFTRRGDKGGTGIGLYMVSRLVEGLGGTVTNYGRPGRGTTFAIFLPLAEEP